jgi:hypothetical protein
LIGMVLKKLDKSADINITYNFEKSGVVMDHFISRNVTERERWMRERVCEKGVLSRSTDGITYRSPN